MLSDWRFMPKCILVVNFTLDAFMLTLYYLWLFTWKKDLIMMLVNLMDWWLNQESFMAIQTVEMHQLWVLLQFLEKINSNFLLLFSEWLLWLFPLLNEQNRPPKMPFCFILLTLSQFLFIPSNTLATAVGQLCWNKIVSRVLSLLGVKMGSKLYLTIPSKSVCPKVCNFAFYEVVWNLSKCHKNNLLLKMLKITFSLHFDDTLTL